MNAHLKIMYWKSERFWLGRLVDHPEIMSQGESVEELEANLRDAYREILMEDVPERPGRSSRSRATARSMTSWSSTFANI